MVNNDACIERLFTCHLIRAVFSTAAIFLYEHNKRIIEEIFYVKQFVIFLSYLFDKYPVWPIAISPNVMHTQFFFFFYFLTVTESIALNTVNSEQVIRNKSTMIEVKE